MRLFDSHCHLDDAAFDGDRAEVLAGLPQKGVARLVWCGTDLASSRQSLQSAQQHDYIYSACGFYPHQTAGLKEALPELEEMLLNSKCVALGEIGLDYHYDDVAPAQQQQALQTQFALATRLQKPVILHERDALPDMLGMLKENHVHMGVVHCFSGSRETAQQYLDMGLYISFTGLLTFKNAHKAQESAAYIPRNKVLIETDSPYMTPVPFRGERNNPARVAMVAAKLAELWGVSLAEAAEQTYCNACQLFGLEP